MLIVRSGGLLQQVFDLFHFDGMSEKDDELSARVDGHIEKGDGHIARVDEDIEKDDGHIERVDKLFARADEQFGREGRQTER